MLEFTENNEKELLILMAEGNEIAFSRLFHNYRDKLYSFVFALSASRQLAEDTVQEVFLKIWQKREDARHIREFDAYLFRMARNHILNSIKRLSKETVILSELEQQQLNQIGSSTTELEFKEANLSVLKAIESLPGRQKQVFILSRNGVKQAEISRMLNISIPTVKSHITHAMISIRKQFKSIHPLIKIFLLATISFSQ